MSNSRIGKDASGSSNVSFQLQQVTFNSVRKVLPDSAIEQACRDVGHAYRARVLTPIVSMLHMILAAIWPEESFEASSQLLWDNAVAAFPDLQGELPSSGSFAKARARLPLELWQSVWDFLAAKVQGLSEPFAFWRGHRVVLADGTCVSMPDTPELHTHFGTSTGRGGKRHYPLARMVTLALANTLLVLTYAVGRYNQSEKELLLPLLGSLRKGDLLLGDRLFAGANLYAQYQAAGLDFLTRAHQRLIVWRLRPLAGYSPTDFVTDLRIDDAYRRKDPALPAYVRVRLIQAVLRIRGQSRLVRHIAVGSSRLSRQRDRGTLCQTLADRDALGAVQGAPVGRRASQQNTRRRAQGTGRSHGGPERGPGDHARSRRGTRAGSVDPELRACAAGGPGVRAGAGDGPGVETAGHLRGHAQRNRRSPRPPSPRTPGASRRPPGEETLSKTACHP